MAADHFAAVPSVVRELYYHFGTPGDTGVEYSEEGMTLVAKRIVDLVLHIETEKRVKRDDARVEWKDIALKIGEKTADCCNCSFTEYLTEEEEKTFNDAYRIARPSSR